MCTVCHWMTIDPFSPTHLMNPVHISAMIKQDRVPEYTQINAVRGDEDIQVLMVASQLPRKICCIVIGYSGTYASFEWIRAANIMDHLNDVNNDLRREREMLEGILAESNGQPEYEMERLSDVQDSITNNNSIIHQTAVRRNNNVRLFRYMARDYVDGAMIRVNPYADYNPRPRKRQRIAEPEDYEAKAVNNIASRPAVSPLALPAPAIPLPDPNPAPNTPLNQHQVSFASPDNTPSIITPAFPAAPRINRIHRMIAPEPEPESEQPNASANAAATTEPTADQYRSLVWSFPASDDDDDDEEEIDEDDDLFDPSGITNDLVRPRRIVFDMTNDDDDYDDNEDMNMNV